MIGLLLRCYPEGWRSRYGEEFAALLQERPLGPLDVADVLLGALDARLHLRGVGQASPVAGGTGRALRTGGYAAIGGGLSWTVVFVASAFASDGGAWSLLVIPVATLLLLVALTALSAFQARHHPRLVWAAFLLPAASACLSLLGILAMLLMGDRPLIADAGPWHVWMLGTAGMLIGSGLFAFATWRVGALPRAASATLALGSMAIVPMLAGAITGALPQPLAAVVTVIAMTGFGGGWAWIGIAAVRRDRALAMVARVP